MQIPGLKKQREKGNFRHKIIQDIFSQKIIGEPGKTGQTIRNFIFPLNLACL